MIDVLAVAALGAMPVVGGGGLYLMNKWMSSVDTTLGTLNTTVGTHSEALGVLKTELEGVGAHVDAANGTSNHILDELRGIRDEQIQVRVELKTYRELCPLRREGD